MPNAKSLDGQRFGRLIVKQRHPVNSKFGNAQWECSCDCGGSIIVVTGSLTKGLTKSCGCIHKEAVSKHGMANSAEYSIWRGIKDRCFNPQSENYANYGGRGITMSDEWKDNFEAFYRDMGPRPTSAHSVDREKNNEGYSKENCRWATPTEQANNRSNNAVYEIDGIAKSLKDWCRYFRVDYNVARRRIARQGWTFEEAIQSIEKKLVTYDGATATLQDWCDLLDLAPNQVYLRVLRGELFEDIVRS